MTSPGRESNLAYCLEMLCQQSLQPAQVLVIDDGSDCAEAQRSRFQARLPLAYDWRPNDQSPALSRNRGAALAESPFLVFIDCDILLNPDALVAYQAYLSAKPDALLYGYMGSDLETQAVSAFFPERQVNYFDKRYHWDGQQLKARDMIYHSAYECAYSGNFALSKSVYQIIGGFDERFKGWGGEDLDFAERAVRQGYEVHFLVNAWGEHQVHSRQEPFHLKPAESREHFYSFRPHASMPYRVRSLGAGSALADLEQLLKTNFSR